MKTALLTMFLTVSVFVCGQRPLEISLWQGQAPNSNGLSGKDAQSTLFVYLPSNPNGMAIVACPGGGYAGLAIEHEGTDMADWFNAQGITYAVLKYRMPNGHNDVPLSDAHQAIRLMKQHASEWGIRQIGIMGSSAGGHLASTAATHFDEETRPDFQILFYPVITMRESTHAGSRENLLGKQPDPTLIEEFSNELQVTPQTPPAFIMHSSDDRSVPIANSLKYTEALVENGVPVSLHVYPVGGHGWGYRDRFIYKRQWTGELEKWLRMLNR